VALPLMLVWAADPAAAWRRVRTWEGALLIVILAMLTTLAVSSDELVTYMVFPALIWAAFRFGPPGATLSVAITALLAIGLTANDVGPFSEQPIDHKTLSTQLYIFVAALTALLLSAIVCERERSTLELAGSKEREDERAVEERHRIARDLHDSVSQALFSTALHTRAAQKALKREGVGTNGAVGEALDAIGETTRTAQSEMRALIFQLGRDRVEGGLVAALASHASRLGARNGLTIDVQGPEDLRLSRGTETQLFRIGREALANVVQHAEAKNAWVRVETRSDLVVLEVRDDGRGFDPTVGRPGHFGLESMQSRAGEVGGLLTISAALGDGTVVRVEAPTESTERRDD
jgi:signal transduction histidine kinase